MFLVRCDNMNNISEIIKENENAYMTPITQFSYKVLREKIFELAHLGIKIGCWEKGFESALLDMSTTEMYSKYSLSKWGYFTPALDDFVITNVKRPKRLYKSIPKATMYYQYLFSKNKLVSMDLVENDKTISRKYFYCLANTKYSFHFFWYKNRVDIRQAVYNEKGDILSFASIITAGIPKEELSEEKVKKIIDSSILDFQYYHYDENGKLDYADNYRRIYNFSPQLVGMTLGDRYKFIYDEEGKLVDAEFDKNAVPCVFELEHPENEKFDPRNRSYEHLKKMKFL